LKNIKILSRFSFDTTGAKEKLSKENAEDCFALCGAREGLRALHCASF
jgi:hypothetical protein